MNRSLFFRAAWLIVLVAMAWPLGVMARPYSQCPADTDGVDTDGDGLTDNDHVCRHLAAGDGFVNMADGRLLYMFGFSDVTGMADDMVMMHSMLTANFPAPTLQIREGQKLFLTLTNVGMLMRPDLFDPHSVHWHGFANAAPVFDGVPDSSVSVIMGSSLTYFYDVRDAGTYMYHCHVEASEHMQMGMLGNLFVTPRQDGTAITYPAGSGRVYTRFAYNDGDGSTGYDVAYPLQLSSFDPDFHDASLAIQALPFANMRDTYPMLNGRGYPATTVAGALSNTETGNPSQPVSSRIVATQGQRILLRISSLSTTEFFTVTVLGIPMQVVGKDARLLRGPTGLSTAYRTNEVTLGGGQSADVILDTLGVPKGTYFLYSTNLNQLSNGFAEDMGGMMTEIIVQ